MQDFVPSDAYHSCAYYENPTAEMERKGWLGADLIFDIDVDHIPTPCNKIHDEWTCRGCGFSGKGITPERCPICGDERFEAYTWLCQDCVDTAKSETIKLLDILKSDFGFSDNELHVFFSGHRGYHIYIESEVVQNLDAISRKEIVDYVCGIGFEVDFQSLGGGKVKNASNWYRRINNGLRVFILNAGLEDFERVGLNKKVARTLLERKEKVIQILEEAEPWKSIKGVGPETWKKIFDYCAQKEFIEIDTVVTTDVHRLVRMTNTLHGKTGFKKVETPISRIDDFDPFKDSVAFRKGTVTVSVNNSPQFRIGDEIFGPYKNVKVELPTAAAILLICKGKAEV
ncbi:MAG: DNA primase small subunit domain-containing protein [Candidatus Bathyarchaeia archaeon]